MHIICLTVWVFQMQSGGGGTNAASFIFHCEINDTGRRVRPRGDGSGVLFFFSSLTRSPTLVHLTTFGPNRYLLQSAQIHTTPWGTIYRRKAINSGVISTARFACARTRTHTNTHPPTHIHTHTHAHCYATDDGREKKITHILYSPTFASADSYSATAVVVMAPV